VRGPKHAKEDGVFEVTAADMDTALAGVLDLRDTPGTSNIDPNAHGSGFDRVSAFQDGFRQRSRKVQGLSRRRAHGARAAVQYRGGRGRAEATRRTTPLSMAFPYDIEDYFTQVYPELADGKGWPPLKSIEAVRPGQCADVR